MSDRITLKERLENLREIYLGMRESPARPGDIHAKNYMEAIEKAGRDGVTVEDNVYKTMTRVGHNRWRAGVKEFDE